MKKENKKLKIVINGTEKSKSEVVYNNLIDNMESLELTKDKQIEYLKSRINCLESSIKNKFILITSLMLSFIILVLGLIFMGLNIYILGVVFSILSFILLSFLLIKFKGKVNNEIGNEFSEIEALRKMLNNKLK